MNEENSVRDGQVVSMEYTLRVDDEVIDSSQGGEPLEFLAGHGNIIPGLESKMQGMKIGETQDVTVTPADAYGEYDAQAFLDVPRQEFPNDMKVEQGMELNVRDDDGQSRYARIESVAADSVQLNFNHPLAGKTLKFNVKVVGLREPTAEELEHGHVHQHGHHH
jgi:FKBP-type peptidyl-prolyl cis-trans isomerase SlyD